MVTKWQKKQQPKEKEDWKMRKLSGKKKLANEDSEAKHRRLKRRHGRLSNETESQRLKRLNNVRDYASKVKATETPEQRNTRLEKARRHMSQVRKSETPEQHNCRNESARRYTVFILSLNIH